MSKITVEELEIIVTAKVEDALKELEKMLPQIKKTMSAVGEQINNVDMSKMAKVVSSGTKQITKTMKEAFDPNVLDESFLKRLDEMEQEAAQKTKKATEAIKKEFSNVDLKPVVEKVVQGAGQVKDLINTPAVQENIKQAVYEVKELSNQLQEIKKDNNVTKTEFNISNEEALKQISQLEKEIDSLQKKTTASKLKLDISTEALNNIEDNTYIKIKGKNPNLSSNQLQNKTTLSLASDNSYNALIQQVDKLNTEVAKYEALLDSAKSKLSQLKQYTNQVSTSQENTNKNTNKLQAIFNGVGNTIKGVLSGIGTLASGFNKIFSVVGKVVNTVKKITPHVNSGMKSVLKYAGALFGLRSIYNTLNSAGQAWLSSQDSGAKQLSANIDYMKYTLGSAVAPVIQYVTNLFYQLLKAVQSVIYALFKVNIFANAGASAYNSMANSANKASKANKGLSSIHSEINNVSSNDGSGSGSSGPSFDMSNLDTELTPLQQKLADFFKPLVESWDKYGPQLIAKAKETFSQIGMLLESIGQSFINVFANGTVYTILENILSIIGNIAEAFANAWNYNGNGDIIIQNLATALNNLLIAINNVVQSTGFQEWLNNCSDKFKEITDKLSNIDWQPTVDALSQIGASIGTLALGILSGLVDVFKWFIENPDISGIILSIAAALLLVVNAINAFSGIATVISSISNLASIIGTTISTIISVVGGVSLVIVGIVTAVSSFVSMLSEGFSWLKEAIMLVGIAIAAVGAIILGAPALVAGVIAAVVAVVATLVVAVKEHWNEIKEFISKGIEKIKEIFTNIINWVKDNWQGLLLLLVNPFAGAFKLLYDNCEGFKNFIDNFIQKVITFFQNLWQNVKNIFSNIGSFFSNIWSSISNTFTRLGINIANAISGAVKSGINGVINLIENTINNAIRLINGGIGLINNIPGVNIGLIGTLALPRLAKGGVLTSATPLIAGEYSGASSNPEIVTPQNIMYETFVRALRDNRDNDTPISFNITAIVGNKKIGQIAIEDIRETKRATGEELEVIFS